MNSAAPSLDSLPLSHSANQVLAEFLALTDTPDVDFSGASLLYERAVQLGLTPQAATSPNGSCHLLSCQDGVLAVNLPRTADWELLPAWLGPWHEDIVIAEQDWTTLQDCLQSIPAQPLLTQAHCLGLAVSLASILPPPPPQPMTHHTFPPVLSNIRRDGIPVVVDLSSLWAGPLCSHLLQLAGCRVIRVEDRNRSERLNTASTAFYQRLNRNKELVSLDFHDPHQIEHLKQLLASADIVIEASRPRALRNLGIFAEDFLRAGSNRIWLSITGYGRDGDQAIRIGYGDDAAAAAGLSHLMYLATGRYQIVGDAIADPLTGIHAALYAWKHYCAGDNALVAVSLYTTVSWYLHQELQHNRDAVLDACRHWQQWGHDLPALFARYHAQPHYSRIARSSASC